MRDCLFVRLANVFLRMMPLLRTALVCFAFVGGTAKTLAAGAPVPPYAIKLSPAARSYATAHAIPLDGFEFAHSGETVRAGDRLIVLFAVQDGAASRQWLAEFCAAALTERERKSKPDTGLGIFGLLVSSLHTDTGHTFSFEQAPSALEIQTYGPFGENLRDTNPATTTTSARVLATRDYLAHGLAPMGEIELRLRAAGKKNPGLSFMFRPKFSPEQMTASTARAVEAGFTEEDERVYAESIFSLVQFASLAFRTAGIDAIMSEIADSPTLFSGAFVNLDWNKLQVEDGRDWALPEARVFRLPYKLDSKTKAGGTFFITAPQPPLQNTAGIIGLTVDWTSKPPGKRLTMRVLACRRGGP